MPSVLLLTDSAASSFEVLPALELLDYRVRTARREATSLLDDDGVDAVLIDARVDLSTARSMAQLAFAAGTRIPVIAVMREGGLAAVSAAWKVDDFILDSAQPGEISARLKLATSRKENLESATEPIQAAGVLIDEDAYTARINGHALNLTYKEFELLKHLAQHAGRVFTREQLLSEVWGYDYYGGTRTVDVHIRRLRAKLGSENENLIGTVRNVGYRLSVSKHSRDDEAAGVR